MKPLPRAAATTGYFNPVTIVLSSDVEPKNVFVLLVLTPERRQVRIPMYFDGHLKHHVRKSYPVDPHPRLTLGAVKLQRCWVALAFRLFSVHCAVAVRNFLGDGKTLTDSEGMQCLRVYEPRPQESTAMTIPRPRTPEVLLYTQILYPHIS